MGEGKRRRATKMVYHHTSMLWTNQIWTAGVIEVEGPRSAPHPLVREIKLDPRVRRAMVDFPPVAWFTTRIDIPKCLTAGATILPQGIDGGAKDISEDQRNALGLRRVAIGFPIADIPVMPWLVHPGYTTGEGRELNESAREYGDDPDEWYVSDEPVDLLRATEIWVSPSILRPKLRLERRYLEEVHAMVRLCREVPGAQIAPSWISEEQASILLLEGSDH